MSATAKLAARIDALELRERALLFVALLGVLAVLWQVLLFTPLDSARERLELRVGELHAEITNLERETASLVRTRSQDPDVAAREHLARLRAERERLDGALQEVTAHLVPPERMAGLLEEVLTRETRLKLVRLEGLGAAPVLDAARRAAGADAAPAAARQRPVAAQQAAPAAPGPAVALYRHGLRIDFEGGYLETLDYLRALEALDQQFLWDSVEFRVEAYPRATVSIILHSLSLDDDWIGV